MRIDRVIFILVIVFLLGLQRYIFSLHKNKLIYTGYHYTVNVPKGWTKTVQDHGVRFESPGRGPYTNHPDAVFSIFAKKREGPAMLLDIAFEDVMISYQKDGWEILDHGEIKLDGELTKWMLCRPQGVPNPSMLLSFYNLDDFNNLTQIEYLAGNVDLFNQYREQFEAFKDSIKFNKLF